MDTNQETDQALLARCQQSGYLCSIYKNIDNEKQNFSNTKMIDNINATDWNSVADNILAGCNLDRLFDNPTVTQDGIRKICQFLKEILDNKNNSWITNETDNTRITNFLQGCLNSKKVTYDNLTEWFPADTKNINQIMPHLKAPNPTHKNLLASINIYQIIIPVAAVIALAAIVYKWWSKKAQNAPAEDQTADTPVGTPEDTLQ